MTHLEVERWISDNLARKQREFGVPHWRLTIRYESLEGAACMTCVAWPRYERATIWIDCRSYLNTTEVEELEQDFEHELMHIVHSPYEFVREHLREIMDVLPWNGVAVLFDQAAEMTVRNMERLRHGLTVYGKKAALPELIEPPRSWEGEMTEPEGNP